MFPSPPAFGILLNAIYCNIKSFVLVFSVALDFAKCWILCDVELFSLCCLCVTLMLGILFLW